ncbi:MAG TPA: thioredoxin domain-containing protein [Myxococcota bacterium]|nr:thioredoxin domain-containing protein [Myxococcota bacterium]
MSERAPDRPANRLAAESSAYLRQHMHNPVDWHPWGEEALARARREDKPLLVSIGYSACHWCHVMERESFEDPDTAARMNADFVNVKVDREERPDVDRIYMDFVTRSQGHGGWPLTVFCTPDGRPFTGGTYFPPERRHGMPAFREVLAAVARAWEERRTEVEDGASEIAASLARRPTGVASEPPGARTLCESARRLLGGADRERGGFGEAPKFPTSPALEALLAAVDVLPEPEAAESLAHVVQTCREMARRGLYDHLGGGFHRYCVDAEWAIPHFEKMLYDQGQLLRVYTEAWRRTGGGDADLVWPVRETAGYLQREMAAPDGGFFASQDADSEGEEGRYYVWTPAQVRAVLGDERAAAFCAAYGVEDAGNFEHGTTHLSDRARRGRDAFAAERAELLAARAKRIAPATDRKRLASWNAFAISGLARAGSLLGDAPMLGDAAAACDFALGRLRDERGRVRRVYDEGRARVTGFLEDVAGLLEATLDLYRAGAGDAYLAAAAELAQDLIDRFWDAGEGELFLSPSDGERLVHRPRAEPDGATPNAVGLAALGLQRAGTLAGRAEWIRVAERVLRGHAFVLERAPEAFPTLARAAALAERGVSVALVLGADGDPATRALAARARLTLAPEDAVVVVAPGSPAPRSLDPAWLAGRAPLSGRPTAFVCRGTTCSLPVTSAEALGALAPEPEPDPARSVR